MTIAFSQQSFFLTMFSCVAEDMSLEGNSMKPAARLNSSFKEMKKKHKTPSTMKKVKQSFGKFKAPMKSKVSPNGSYVQTSISEAKETLQEVLEMSQSNDARDDDENYVSIGKGNDYFNADKQ